jgi:4-phytase/acid phosphatase
MMRGRSFLWLRLPLLAGLLPAIALPCAAAEAYTGKVVMQVAVVRHGIRAPTAAPEVLHVWSTDPWPAWSVKPGELTVQGARLMTSVGAWYARDLKRSGLDFGNCAAFTDHLKTIADSKQRDLDSAAAMLKGIAPSCSLHYHAFAAGQKDPLFRGRSETLPDDARITSLDAPTKAALNTLQETLLGCTGPACLDRAKAAGKKLLVNLPADEALDEAGSLAENLMLEYAEGMPLESVGWGRLGGDGIAWIITVHNASFNLRKRPLGPASVRDGNMLAYIIATLTRAAGKTSGLPSLTETANASLILLGHDTDLATQAGLLGVDWHQVTQPDDYPPGGMLIYQLVESDGQYGVRVRVALPTLPGLRNADVLAPGGMHEATVRQPGCGNAEVCPLPRFEKMVMHAIPDSMVIPGSGNEPLVH